MIKQQRRYSGIILLIALSTGLSSCTNLTQKLRSETAYPSPTPSPTRQIDLALPAREGLLNDYADLLNPEAERRVTESLNELNQSGVETVIVLLKSTNGRPIFDYSLQMARDWKIGPTGRGVLYVVAIDDREWRIQVTRSLENVLTEDLCKEIGGRSAQFFKNKEYSAGIESFIKDVQQNLKPTH